MNAILEQLKQQFAGFGPNLLGGLAVLVIGWFVALLASFAVRKILGKLTLDNKIAQWMGGPGAKSDLPTEKWGANAVFCLVMLFVLIAFFQTLKLTLVTDPLKGLLDAFMGYVPKLVGAGVLVLIAWVLATVLKRVIHLALKAAKLDERLGGAAGEPGQGPAVGSSLSEAVYWLVFVLFLPAILDALELKGLLDPVNALLTKVFAFLPNLIAAGIILVVGWFVARIVQRLAASLLASAGLDRLSEKWDLAAALGKRRLSEVVGLALYFLILLPILVSGLNALQLDAVTRPASDMLGKILLLLPSLFGASLILLIAWVVGSVVAGLATNLLAGLGFNNILVTLGLSRQPASGRHLPAEIAGLLIKIAILMFASIEAARVLGLESVSIMIQDFIQFAGHILMGLFVFSLGLMLAQFIAKAIESSDSPHARRLAFVARAAVLALVGAMALRQTGLANEVVNLAFGLTLGAVALASALAFGLGGRETAARLLLEWREKDQTKKP
ncbi:MAG TPA: mechanosensitive ion channel [Candidatus Paceibacterota bacterium]|nr:mechanosensitive ion channel [Verrucomicrobiota bacterium]HRY49765.1 mechanosensitive ion channel [Candidatus Paceibacterota bacterium]HRZ99734.1 mechanosensitive ion channel [Candidatus Paceibacterota bacterium]